MWDYDIEKIKGHLINLPHFNGELPVVEQKSDMLGLFPLFGHYDSPQLLEGYVKAACWARHTWYKNTDAVDVGVPLKFYVQEEMLDMFEPILIENCVDIEKDVLTFKGEGLESKLMAIYGDSQFDEVGWLFQIDCDLFVMDGPIGFFNRFVGHDTPSVGVLKLVDVDYALFGHGLVVRNGLEGIVGEHYRPEWGRFVDVLIELGCSHLINSFLAIPPAIPQPISHMVAVPMRRMNKTLKDWLYRAGQLTYGERVIYSIFNLYEDDGLWELTDLFGGIFHDWDPTYPPKCPHIAHIADTRTESVFRDKIGVNDVRL